MAVTYGMLSTTAEITAEPTSTTIRVGTTAPPVASAMLSASSLQRADVDQRPDQDEQAHEEEQGLPLDVAEQVRGRSGDSRISTPAPTSATTDGATPVCRCSRNPSTIAASTTPLRRRSRGSVMASRSSSARSASALARGRRQGVDRNRHRASSRNAARITRTIGSMCTRKSVNDRSGPAGDDDVGRVAHQGGGAADVRRQRLREQERDRLQPQPVAHEQRDGSDQQHRGHVVEQGRRARGHEDQQHQHPVGPAARRASPTGSRGTRTPRCAG